jgi:hypothetical protein
LRIGSCRERHRRTRRGSRIIIPRSEATWESRRTRPHRGKAIGKIATAFPRLPRAQSALAMTNLLALRHRIRAAKPTACKALNPRKGDAASVRRQSRQRLRRERRYRCNRLVRFIGALYEPEVPSRDCHVGLRPPRNDKLGSLTHSPEIPPDLQLPKAVTDRRYRRNWCIPFSRWPVQIGSASPRLPRRLRLLAMTNLEALTAHIVSLHGGHCPMDKSDIPGFARSDIFLSESDIKASRLL